LLDRQLVGNVVRVFVDLPSADLSATLTAALAAIATGGFLLGTHQRKPPCAAAFLGVNEGNVATTKSAASVESSVAKRC
jgi:hypothetical protein